jgi:hypothetical protein
MDKKSRDSQNLSNTNLGQSESIISVAISQHKGEKWHKMYHFFSNIFQKAKKNTSKKRINLERLRNVQEQIRFNKESTIDTTDNLSTYSPLLVLKLVCYLFSEDGARQKLDRCKQVVWGIRQKEILAYSPPGGSGSQEKLNPREYLVRVIKCCWKAISNTGGEEPNIDEYWFLTQFCKLYGFAATKLSIANNQMLPHLIIIAGFSKLNPFLLKNEDTIYAIQLGYSFLDTKSNYLTSSQILAPLQRSRRATISSQSSINTSSFAQLSRSSLESSLSYNNLASKKITIEMVVLQLMECLTRTKSPVFPPILFHELIKSIPIATSESVPDNLLQEFQMCIEYLLDYETITNFTESSSHWFREGCDQTQLRKINELGLIKYNQLVKSTNSTPTPSCCSGAALGEFIEGGTSKISWNTPVPVKYDPKLIASHLKYSIKSMGGLIPIAVAKSIMSLMPLAPKQSMSSANNNSNKEIAFQWCPDLEEVHLIRLLLGLGSWKFHLLQRVIQLTMHIMYYSTTSKDPIDAFSLAIVLPIIPADLFGSIQDIQRWNFCWGCLIHRGRELFLDPTFAIVIQDKVIQGYKWELMVLRKAGINF